MEETGRVAYQHTISVPLVATPLKRSTVVFVATLTMRYVPGWVLNGRTPEAVEVGHLIGTSMLKRLSRFQRRLKR